MAKPLKFKPDGEPDLRGHGEGSKGTRFAKGDGRKRPGRPKGASDERTLVRLIQDMTVAVNMPGLPKRINTQLAYLLKLREKTLKGDLKAIEILDRKIGQHARPSIQPDLTKDLLAEDDVILRGALQRGVLPTSTPQISDQAVASKIAEADDPHDQGTEP